MGITGFGAAAAAAVLVAPSAGADVAYDGVTLAGDSHYVNTAYTLTVNTAGVSNVLNVWIYDNNVGYIPPNNGNAPGIVPVNNVATFQWIPTTTGAHHITATVMQIGGPNAILGPIDVTVTTAPTGGTGSANSVPVIGQLLSSISAQLPAPL
ncbi:hypothetical protein EBN03_07585 [Nocardia stercoris]|uniref:Uncharacterized protein n=2 Tax=Nocardia stercoris TaxID=2483361 RepID=A0A3M2L9L6_9NOCA|nr:hypothetical protein EBN03_07585 [Nocardia stercoris]